MTSNRPSPGFDNVAFEFEGARIVGTVLDYDDDGLLIVGNPFLGANYHVPVEDAAITNEDITGAEDAE